MIKKITALALAFAMIFSVTAFGASFDDVADGTENAEAIDVLSELGVLSGMGDGSFAPTESLTRAQFAKIAVCIMGKTKEAVVTTSAFSDVSDTDWYSGYVNVVASEGVITGYPDGSFGANEAITYAQAITVLVRLLGYDAGDVGHKWPQGYIDKASVLGITENVYFNSNEAINRETAALLIYRTLFTDMKNSTQALVTKMDFDVYEETVIVATNAENSALLANRVQTDKGIFKFDENVGNIRDFTGFEGTLVVNDESEIIAFVADEEMTKDVYTVQTIYGEENASGVTIVADEGKVTIDNNLTVYMQGNTVAAKTLADGLTPGSSVALFSSKGNLKHALVDEYEYAGPKVYTGNSVSNMFGIKNMTNVKVVRKGLSSSVDEIEQYDVLYYSEKTNTIYAYADRVTGMYEEAYPMKNNVTRVEVSGKEYKLSTIDAINKLNESAGAFEIGDRVTLLFGKDGDVVDAVSLTQTDTSTYGVVIGTGTEIADDDDKKGRMEYYVRILHVDGTEAKYIVEDDRYEECAGKLCSVNFKNSYAVLDFEKTSYISGFVNKSANTAGQTKLSNDVKILEYVDGTKTEADVIAIKLADIDALTLSKTNVKNVVYNKKGEAVILYVSNMSGKGNIYGVIVNVAEGRSNGGINAASNEYTILSGNTKYTYRGSNATLGKGVCVSYYNGASGTTIQALAQLASGSVVNDVTDNVITIDSKAYVMDEDAVIYMGQSAGDLKAVSWQDAINATGRISVYSDKAKSAGGKVRVIKIYTV